MAKRIRPRLVSWSSIDLRILTGRWMLLHGHYGNWRGFIKRVKIDRYEEVLSLTALQLQHQAIPDTWYFDHEGPIPPLRIDSGELSVHHRDFHWRGNGTHLILTPPRVERPRPQPRFIDPMQLRSSGGTRLRRFE